MIKPTDSYTDSYGKKHKTYKDYCNSSDLDYDVIAIKLMKGDRIPQNKRERRLLEGIKELEKKGVAIEFPFD